MNCLSPFVQALCSKPKAFPVLTKLVPACQELNKSISEEKSESFQQLVFYCISCLEAATKTASVCPADWSLSVSLPCKCVVCVELQKFLKHPTQTEYDMF